MPAATWSDVRMLMQLHGVQVQDVEERMGIHTGALSRIWGLDPEGAPSLAMWMRIRDVVLGIDAEQRAFRDRTIMEIMERGDRRPARA